VLRAQASKPTRSYIHEPVVPVIVHVDVRHVTDEAAPGVEDAPLAQFALGGTRVLGNASRMSFMGPPLPRAVRSAPLPTVRSGAIRPSVRPVYRYPKRERKAGPIARVLSV
jgi:hypothetical protein